MYKSGDNIVYSASDLVGFLSCRHKSALDRINLDTPLEQAKPDEQIDLIQDKGYAHEASFLEKLRTRGGRLVELSSKGDFATNVAATHAAMSSGADIIFQAALSENNYMGYADFLVRVDRPSTLGDWSYEVSDTKLAHRPKPKFMIQLAHYSQLITNVQGTAPEFMHLEFGNHTSQSFRVNDYVYYYKRLRERFEEFVSVQPSTSPEKCDFCKFCVWRERCDAEWETSDHLNRVANITSTQINRLRKSGIDSLAQLASIDPKVSIQKISPATLSRLASQASLQQKKKETGINQIELLPEDPAPNKGFSRLPLPNDGDLYFDMEGDPMHEGGLEYLFGVYYMHQGQWTYIDFWAHERSEEKRAFIEFMDFVGAHLNHYPQAYIYHYANYEPAALKKLMSLHGVYEAAVDQLLRDERFVDLYKVVREAIRVSEPRYSIKNLETFYMDKRAGEVTSAGASIVYYEKWRQTREEELLRKIRDYNKDDCISTQLLHQWLLSIKPEATSSAEYTQLPSTDSSKSASIQAHEDRLKKYEGDLLSGLPTNEDEWNDEHRLRSLMFHLLDFHRRAAKPAWWELFSRRDLSEEELVDDSECIAGLELVSVQKATTARGAHVVSYQYPEQEFKLREGQACTRTDTAESFGKIDEIDEDQNIVKIRLGNKKEIPDYISIASGGPINTATIKEALFRIADGLIARDGRYSAALEFLRKAPPRIKNHKVGTPVINDKADQLPQIIEAVVNLDESTLFIQGPPGSGKTYTGSHVIVALMAQGYRVGVTSNSHKAVHNLLYAVEEVAELKKLAFAGVYKASAQATESEFDGNYIGNASTNEEVALALDMPETKLIAGTAWLFSDPLFDQALDYLFVDEAGQVAAANLVAMATSSKNVVLLGDQMQLSQPIQGVHPGETGLSSLDYLLQGRATIPPDQGVFLATTWRMHPDVCQFISDAIYESRLFPEADNTNQKLILDEDNHESLKRTGIVFVPATHDGCSQRSDEEAEIVRSLYDSLLKQRYQDRAGDQHLMTKENILVVAPYNMQVNLLRRSLPEGARVGTVDKFQGQEAEVVIISMATSSSEYLPRNIEFLYSKNRLNVAISRARSLALLVANPALTDTACSTVEQMGLVNLMCAAVCASTAAN